MYIKYEMFIAVNFPNSEKKNLKFQDKKSDKHSGFKGLRTLDLRNTSAMFYQLSFVFLQIIQFISLLSRENEDSQLTSLPMRGFGS